MRHSATQQVLLNRLQMLLHTVSRPIWISVQQALGYSSVLLAVALPGVFRERSTFHIEPQRLITNDPDQIVDIGQQSIAAAGKHPPVKLSVPVFKGSDVHR